jgi:biopolymer transport protein ExbD
MGKIKPARKSTRIDMTAMVDLAFLLLTFFMLATNFKGEDAAEVTTPTSISDTLIPDADVMLITVDDSGRVFFGIDNKDSRAPMLIELASANQLTFTDEEVYIFSLMPNIGMPIKDLKGFLSLPPLERDKAKKNQPGIPCDTINNELAQWIVRARLAHKQIKDKDLRAAVKGDKNTKYPVISNVVETFRELRVHNFALVTSLENDPRDKK